MSFGRFVVVVVVVIVVNIIGILRGKGILHKYAFLRKEKT